MRALQFTAYGGPEVLKWAEAPDPHAGPGQIRIAVRAASVNPIDWKILSGSMSGGQPLAGTGCLGFHPGGVEAQTARAGQRLAPGHGPGQDLPVDRVHAGRTHRDPNLPGARVRVRGLRPLEYFRTPVRRELQGSHPTVLPRRRDIRRLRQQASAVLCHSSKASAVGSVVFLLTCRA